MTPKNPTPNQPYERGPWHDRFFRSHFKSPEQIRSLLQLAFTPSQLALFDLNTLTVEPNSQVDPETLTEALTDLRCQLRLKNASSVAVSIIVDHKSNKDSKLFRQLLKYVSTGYTNDADAVLPVVIYHGWKNWKKDKNFHAFEHEALPGEFLSEFGNKLVNFEAIFVNLQIAEQAGELEALRLKERLVLEVLVQVWGADENSYVRWLKAGRELESLAEGKSFARGSFAYLMKIRPQIKISKLRQALSSTMPGDQRMQELAKQWEGEYPDSCLEWKDVGIKEGILQGKQEGIALGKEEGIVEGIRQRQIEVAKRMIQEGDSDERIHRITDLDLEEIAQLKTESD